MLVCDVHTEVIIPRYGHVVLQWVASRDPGVLAVVEWGGHNSGKRVFEIQIWNVLKPFGESD